MHSNRLCCMLSGVCVWCSLWCGVCMWCGGVCVLELLELHDYVVCYVRVMCDGVCDGICGGVCRHVCHICDNSIP